MRQMYKFTYKKETFERLSSMHMFDFQYLNTSSTVRIIHDENGSLGMSILESGRYRKIENIFNMSAEEFFQYSLSAEIDELDVFHLRDISLGFMKNLYSEKFLYDIKYGGFVEGVHDETEV